MSIPYLFSLQAQLPDGEIFDTVKIAQAPVQQTTKPLSDVVAADTADIQAQIDAAKAKRDRIKVDANKPGLGPKAKATRQKNLLEAENTLKALQEEKKGLLSAKPVEPDITPDDGGGDGGDGDTGGDNPIIPRDPRADLFDATAQANLEREATNARAIFDNIFKQYFNRPGDDRFISDLTKFVEDSISKGYTADTISALLPQTEAYKTRFKGNEGRIKAGLAAYSPAEYLQAEDTYAEILNRFNLGSLATRDQFSDFISNRKSASEVADLVQNVYFRINNADPALRQQLEQLKGIGKLTDADLAKAILTGPEGAQVLKQKIAGAEVATEAAARGLSPIRSQQLANLGVTREQARAGFEAIAQTQPTFEKLSDIYEPMTAPKDKAAAAARSATFQEELEKEQFQGLRSENRARLAQQEQAAFMGQSGTQGIGIRRRSQRGLIQNLGGPVGPTSVKDRQQHPMQNPRLHCALRTNTTNEREMVAMSNNEWLDDDNDFEDDDSTNYSDSDLVKKLRRAARANEKRAKELEAELVGLRTEQRKNIVKSVLESKGVRPSIAKYIPENVSTAEDIDTWLADNAEDFGITLGQPKQETDLATLRQIDAVTANAVSPAGVDDLMLRLNQAESAEDIERIIYGS